MSREQHLVMPLVPLPAGPRVLRLDERADWADQVRTADEPCLLVDGAGRLAAISAAAAQLLQTDALVSTGVRLLDLLTVVDFTETGVPLADPRNAVPPLRSLATGRLTRGLVRLRLPFGGTPTLDVVGVPVAGGALAFLSEV